MDRTHIEKYSSFFCINKTKVPSHLYPTLIMASLLLGQSMTVYCQVHDILILNTYLKLDRLVSNKQRISRSAHRTTNFMNPESQFPQFKVLQSVFIFLM